MCFRSSGLACLALALAAALGTGAPAVQAQTSSEIPGVILPGYWSYTTSAFVVIRKTERRCIRRHEIDRVMSGAINEHYTCDYPNRTVGDGRVNMRGTCRDKKGRRVSISMRGSFSPTTLDLDATIAGIPVNLKGRRLGAACPNGEQPGA